MTFAHPQLLWFLPVIPPLLALFFWWSWRARQKLMTRFIQARLLHGLIAGVSPVRQQIRAVCLIVAVVALIVALARPRWGYDMEEVTQRGIDIVVAIDTSKSMLADDIAPNRLARAKLAALDLMRLAKSDRLGLVAFAGSAFLECPLTIDDAAFRQSVEALDVYTLPQGGTAIADAIETALHAFKEEDNHKVLVLFTDGEDHDSGALEAAKKAADAGMLIFTVGIGSPEGELLRIQEANGQMDFVRDEEGNVVKSHLNESLLQQIAKAGAPGGVYVPLRGANTMDALYQHWLALLPRTESREKWTKRPHEQYHWPLALAIALLILEVFLPERKRRPARSASAATATTTLARAAVVGLLLLPAAAFGSPGSAMHNYRNGKYAQARAEYERLIEEAIGKKNVEKEKLLEKALEKLDDQSPEQVEELLQQLMHGNVPNVGKLEFNAGASAYKAGDLNNAASHFTLAASDPDWRLQEKAYYNLGNTRYKLGEQANDPKEKMSQWSDAVARYSAATNLDMLDADARHNLAFVQQKLEELKQQQQKEDSKKNQQQKEQEKKDPQQDQQNQQSKNDQQKQDSKDPKDQKQDSGQQQAKNDQQQQQQNQDQKNQQQQDQQKKDQEKKDQQQKDQEKKDPQQKEKDRQQAKGSSGSEKNDEKSGEQQPAQAYAAGEMTPQQARQLLDAQKNEEMLLPARPDQKGSLRHRSTKDW